MSGLYKTVNDGDDVEKMPYYKVLATDPVLRKIMLQYGIISLETQSHFYWILIKSVISQQIATKVAALIYERLCALYSDFPPDFDTVLDTPKEVLRNVGLSERKITYIYNIVWFFKENGLTDAHFPVLMNNEITNLLTRIKGIGKWTADMFLIFALARPDVFPKEDFGIQKAMAEHYRLSDSLSPKERFAAMEHIAEKWKPYRTYASRYLWKVINTTWNW